MMYLSDAIKIIFSRMTQERRILLPFRHGAPDRSYLRNFRERHRGELAFAKILRQESKRMAANNGEVLTTHLEVLSKPIGDNSLDDSRVFNLDESGSTTEEDLNGNVSCRRFLSKRGSRDYRINTFSYLNYIIMMPVISASGYAGPPLFVFKGTRMSYCTVLRDGISLTETPACKLPSVSTFALREKNGGVYSLNFTNWAYDFVDFVKALTKHGQKFLLIYDAYRAHVSLDVLEILHGGNVIVYALPAHTSGRTQPLDVILFFAFKAKLNSILSGIVPVESSENLDIFDICGILPEAYQATFISAYIRAGFRKTAFWPFDQAKLLSECLPENIANNSDLLTVEELAKLIERKRQEYREKLLESDAVITASGYGDTTNGYIMKSTTVMELVRDEAEKDRKKFLADKKAERQKEAKENKRRLLAVPRRQYFEIKRIERQAQLAGIFVKTLMQGRRPLKERRLVAKRNSEAKRRAF